VQKQPNPGRSAGRCVDDPEPTGCSRLALDYPAFSHILDVVDFASAATSPHELCRGAAELLCKSADGHQAVVGLQNRADTSPHLIVVHGDQSWSKPYADYFHRQDPADLTQYLSGKEPLHPSGSVLPRIASCDMVNLGEALRSEFFVDFLAPQNVYYSLVAYLRAGPLRAVLCIHRGRTRGAFPLSAVKMMERLTPYLSANLTRTVDEMVMSALDLEDEVGVLIVSEDAQLLYSNSLADSFLRAASGNRSGIDRAGMISSLLTTDQTNIETAEGSYSVKARRSSVPQTGSAWVIRVQRLSDPLTQQATLLRSRFGFTSRELEVLADVVEGYANKQIACRLSVTEDTVKKHIQNMSRKANVSNRTGLVHVALRELRIIN
jgi:DNA-binding CsgD family transcriptional regulator